MKNPAVIINLKNAEYNLGLIKQLAKEAEIIAVVKDNAYGHGLCGMAVFLQKHGVNRFAVGTLEEGRSLRETGVEGDILVLGATPPEKTEELVNLELSQSVFDGAYAKSLEEAARAKGLKLKTHIKIDTGMNRLGFDWFKTDEIAHSCSTNRFETQGIFTHFAYADGKGEDAELLTRLQGERFLNCLSELDKSGFDYGVPHCCNSAALFRFPQYKCGAVRVGAALYGIGGESKNLKPVLSMRAPILQIRYVKAGEFVGYGGRRLDKTAKLGIVGAGYGHGISRKLSDKGFVFVNGQKCAFVGSVCMDFSTVDLTGVEAKAGDDAWIVGGDLTAAKIARCCGTIDYETVTCLSSGLERILAD